MILAILPLLAVVLSSSAAPSSRLKARADSLGIWPSQTYVTENVTAPDMTVWRSGDTASGYLFLTPSGNGTDVNAPVVMTDSNELVWRGPAGGFVYNNFKVQTLHNNPHLTSWFGNSSATFGHGYGAISIWDTSYTEIYRVCPPGLDLVTPNFTTYTCYLDMHESYLTDQGTIIATAYNVTQRDLTSVGGPENGWIFDSIFFEVDIVTQQVLFRWRSLDQISKIPLSQSQYPLQLGPYKYAASESLPWDYFHINSVQPLSDGYLVNSRHLFSMYKVSLSGDVEWQLSGLDGGDFTLDPGIYFSWQHNPRVSNVTNSSMTITLFNNDNSEAQVNEGTNGTTGLALFLDFETMHVSLERRLQNSSEKLVAASQGSYQSLEQDHVLMGYGQIATTREFDAAGSVIYEAQYGYSNATSMVASYRSYRQVWAAQPAAPPKAAVQCKNEQATLFMSWNGATTVQNWGIFAGNSIANLSLVGLIERSGFETSFPVNSSYQFVIAAAEAEGTWLGNSSTVAVACG